MREIAVHLPSVYMEAIQS